MNAICKHLFKIATLNKIYGFWGQTPQGFLLCVVLTNPAGKKLALAALTTA